MRTALPRVLALLSLPIVLPAQAAWQRLYPPQSPPLRAEALMSCFEPTGDVLLLFGGNNSGSLVDSWKFDGTTWTQVTATLPPYRSGGAMVCDANRQRLVLFGGGDVNTNLLQDTWEWNGTSWLNRSPAVKPPVRKYHGMAFDRRRGVTVVFSGLIAYGPVMGQDLWEWNGTAWLQRTPAGMPAGRSSPHMCFDPARQDVLMSGGWISNTNFEETWSWDGANWLLHQPATPPSSHPYGQAVADLHRRRVVLHGDDADMFSWEWDGAEWSLRLQASPGTRNEPAMAYDPVRRRVVLFGGYRGVYLGDTWIYRTPNPAEVVPYGMGCAGSAGVPQLANAPYSLPWLGDTFTNRVTNLAPAAAGVVFATGFVSTVPINLAAFGMPGCDQLVIPAVSEFRLATAGAAEWTLAIPNTTALANVHLFQQAFALDAAANAAGLVASNGVQITTGIR